MPGWGVTVSPLVVKLRHSAVKPPRGCFGFLAATGNPIVDATGRSVNCVNRSLTSSLCSPCETAELLEGSQVLDGMVQRQVLQL